MKAPTHVECDIGVEKYREHCEKLHKEKMKFIKRRKSPHVFSKDDDIMFKINESLMKAHQYAMTTREAAIQQANRKLLTKLTDISEGKLSIFRDKFRASESNLVRSLNFMSRKLEDDRIERENLHLAKRILAKNSYLNVKAMEDDYQEHIKLKKQLLREHLKKNRSILLLENRVREKVLC